MAMTVCSRSGDVLQLMLTPQWYVQVTDAPAAGMATSAAAAARCRSVTIRPGCMSECIMIVRVSPHVCLRASGHQLHGHNVTLPRVPCPAASLHSPCRAHGLPGQCPPTTTFYPSIAPSPRPAAETAMPDTY